MSDADSYRRNADECRKLALRMKDPEHKKQLEDMAAAWEAVANQRVKKKKTRAGESSS